MKNLFAYGTLMCNDIMAEVCGASLSHVPAILTGFRRLCVRGEPYPAVIPDADAAVEGALYVNMPRSAWPRLDRFEGAMYSREVVQVERGDGAIMPAEVYVIRPEFARYLADEEWDFDAFLRLHKSSYLRG